MEYKRLMTALEAAGKLDRALEFLPTDDELNERAANGLGGPCVRRYILSCMTRAALAVVLTIRQEAAMLRG